MAFILWYRRRNEAERQALVNGPGAQQDAQEAASAAGPVLGASPLDKLLAFAAGNGLSVTSTTGGSHNPGSLHYQGRAIDVSVRGLVDSQIEQLKALAGLQGIHVLDERSQLPGEKVWSGPHLHFDIPAGMGGN